MVGTWVRVTASSTLPPMTLIRPGATAVTMAQWAAKEPPVGRSSKRTGRRVRLAQTMSPCCGDGGVERLGGDDPVGDAVARGLAGGVDVGGVRLRIGEAAAGAGDAHDVADEGGGPGVVAVAAGGEDAAVRVVLAGPAGFGAAGVHAEPPVFADALPQAGDALGLFVRRRRRAGVGGVVVDGWPQRRHSRRAMATASSRPNGAYCICANSGAWAASNPARGGGGRPRWRARC